MIDLPVLMSDDRAMARTRADALKHRMAGLFEWERATLVFATLGPDEPLEGLPRPDVGNAEPKR